MRVKIYVEDENRNRASLEVHAWNLIKDVKDAIQADLHIPAARQRLFFSNRELRNHRSVYDANIMDGAVIFLALNPVSPMKASMMRFYGNTPCPPRLKKIVGAARLGLVHGLAPRLAMDGTGGTYFLRNARRDTIAVFKPADEEPFAPSNPRNYVGKMGQQGFRRGIQSGEGYLREVAAYLLDRKSNFSGVPMTTVVEMQDDAFHFHGKGLHVSQEGQSKVGSLQEYVRYDDVAGDLAAKMFPVEEVHKIAILDIRIANTDRNDANILVRRPPNSVGLGKTGGRGIHLIPIDHGYSLPDTLEISWTDWVWLEWPQAKVPFGEKAREFVRNLDIEADIAYLKKTLGIRDACLRTMRITGTTLKKGVEAGLTLRQIAGIMCRNDLDIPSDLEVMCTQAYKMAQAAQEQLKIKSFSVVSLEVPRLNRTRSAEDSCLSRSISFSDFKPLEVHNNGFKISQIAEKSSEDCQKRLDPSTHTWHLDDGRKNESKRVQVSCPVSKLFFEYLEKLLDQHVALIARQSPRLDPIAVGSAPSSPSCSPSKKEPSSPWFALQSPTQAVDETAKTLSFRKTAIVVDVKGKPSMISEALTDLGKGLRKDNSPVHLRGLQKNKNAKSSETAIKTEKSWDMDTPMDVYGAGFSPIATPLGKSSDSEWSRPELESEERSGTDAKMFHPHSRVSGFAPPLGNISIPSHPLEKNSTSGIPMSIPSQPLDIRHKKNKPMKINTVSRSAPKVPAWKPSWKLRRERIQAQAQVGSLDVKPSSPRLPPMPVIPLPKSCAKLGPTKPRRVVGGFSSAKPSTDITQYSLAASLNTALVFNNDNELAY
uniref:1-phosphatidylinositol 4-kinase n=1 Tax=Lotharella oceanica TaxID=641309 RepID=A0A7S2XF66_9EUKA